MNFGSAASIGVELLQHRQEIGSVLSGGLGLGKAAGQGFAKIAERFNLPKGLGEQVQQGLQKLQAASPTSGREVLDTLQYFDADRNGQVSKQELTDGLQNMRDSGVSSSGSVAKLYQTGTRMLKHYDRLAIQDGNAASLSYKDMGQLLAQDGNITSLSTTDWTRLNA